MRGSDNLSLNPALGMDIVNEKQILKSHPEPIDTGQHQKLFHPFFTFILTVPKGEGLVEYSLTNMATPSDDS